MLLKNLNNLIPFKSIFRMLLILSFFVQITIISYNHLSGYYITSNWMEYVSRIFFSTGITFGAALIIGYFDLFIIWYLNKTLSWDNSISKRILIQFIASISISIIMADSTKTKTLVFNAAFIKTSIIFIVLGCKMLLIFASVYCYHAPWQ